MYKIAICDDEKSCIEQFIIELEKVQKSLKIETKRDVFDSASNLLCAIEEGQIYDIVVLDIEIGKDNGINIAEKIMKEYPSTIFIFMTGYNKYVYDAFAVRPCGFLVKPFDSDKVQNVFERAVKLCDKEGAFFFSINGVKHKAVLSDIYYFISSGRKIEIKMKNEKMSFYEQMDTVMEKLEKLSSTFIRINQSVIINAKYITGVKYISVTIDTGGKEEEFSVSQTYRPYVRDKFAKLWKS